MTRLALLERLKQLQHMPKFQERDITTISALLSNEALANHVKVCEDAVSASNGMASQNGRSKGGEHSARSGQA